MAERYVAAQEFAPPLPVCDACGRFVHWRSNVANHPCGHATTARAHAPCVLCPSADRTTTEESHG